MAVQVCGKGVHSVKDHLAAFSVTSPFTQNSHPGRTAAGDFVTAAPLRHRRGAVHIAGGVGCGFGMQLFTGTLFSAILLRELTGIAPFD